MLGLKLIHVSKNGYSCEIANKLYARRLRKIMEQNGSIANKLIKFPMNPTIYGSEFLTF